MITFKLANYYYFSFFLRSSRTVSPVVQIKLGAILQRRRSLRVWAGFLEPAAWRTAAQLCHLSIWAIDDRTEAAHGFQIRCRQTICQLTLLYLSSELDTWIHNHHLCRHRPNPPHITEAMAVSRWQDQSTSDQLRSSSCLNCNHCSLANTWSPIDHCCLQNVQESRRSFWICGHAMLWTSTVNALLRYISSFIVVVLIIRFVRVFSLI